MSVQDVWTKKPSDRSGGTSFEIAQRKTPGRGPELGSERQQDAADWTRKMDARFATEDQTRKPARKRSKGKRTRTR